VAFTGGADVEIGGVQFRVDKNAPEEIGKPSYRHWTRSLFSGRTDISGRPGAQNLNPDLMRWYLTDFSGEGQLILPPDDPDLFTRFWRSEGLNLRTPGQAKLNTSTILQAPADASGGATVTKEGAADFTDVTGTSTTSGTDRMLSAVDDIVQSTDHTPGASQVQVDFHLYQDPPVLTTVQGGAFTKYAGDGEAVGSDFKLRTAGTAVKTAVSGPTPGAYSITYTISWLPPDHPKNTATPHVALAVVDFTDDETVVVETVPVAVAARFPTTEDHTIQFTAVAGHNYSVRFRTVNMGRAATIVLDKITHGSVVTPVIARVSIYNLTDLAEVSTRSVSLTNTTTAQVASMTFVAVAAKAYRYRVQWDDGPQMLWVDKVAATLTTTGTWTLNAIELGQGGKVWLAGSQAAVNAQTWFYDFSTESWTLGPALNATATAGEVIRTLAHSDTYEYALSSGGTILRFDASADAVYGTSFDSATGIVVAQGRMFVLCETSTAVTIYTLGLDTGTYAGEASALGTATVASANVSPDTTLRQRMCAAPTGARFFVNYSVEAVVYEADSSGSTLVVRELARLGPGLKATAIAQVGAVTFLAVQAITETGETPVSTLWVIDANGIPRSIGDFRKTNGVASPVVSMQAYQRDLWAQQGQYIWRYSLSAGGLALEYELNPTTPANQRGIAVVQGHQFAAYSQEQGVAGAVWAMGSLSTYRQSSSTDGNTLTSSVYNFGLPGTEKLLVSIDVLTDVMPAGTAVTVEAQLNQSGTWISIGTATSGSANTFIVSSEATSLTFDTLQLRITLTSTDGTATPTLETVVVKALPTESEEFFDLIILTEDEDSNDHPSGEQKLGGERAQALWGMWQQGTPTLFTDGYQISSPYSGAQEYLVRVEDCDHSNDQVGEGRMSVRLRVLR
jgi:hypothetical protein